VLLPRARDRRGRRRLDDCRRFLQAGVPGVADGVRGRSEETARGLARRSGRMMSRLLLAVLACVALAASASASEPAKKAPRQFTPEVHGVLMSGRTPVSTNVCLRQGDTEIRTCGYADASGRFYIPSSGPMHSANVKSDGRPEE